MRILVTGGGGFLGGALVRRLRARGDEVRSFSRGAYPEMAALGSTQFRGDLADADAVARAAEGCETIFHAAAKAGIWGPHEEYQRVNVQGTEHVLAACRKHGIRRLVFTGSPSVTFDGRDQEGVDESAPYAARFLAHYPQTKAQAERLVLQANSAALATVSLRPHLIWGPGDHQLVPRILERARAGRLWLLAPRGKRVDSVYLDNAVDAHVLAAERLAPGGPVAGKTYFITNGEPLPLEELINGILGAAGLPPVTRRLPGWLAYAAGAGLECVYGLLGRTQEPPLTRFLARQLATAHWFDISAARRDLGYAPGVSIREGLRRLEKSLAGVKHDPPQAFGTVTKVL